MKNETLKNTKDKGCIVFKLLPEITYTWEFWQDVKLDEFKCRVFKFNWLGLTLKITFGNGK